MWLVPVSTFLQFEYLPSHQEALSKGMLVQYTSEIAGRVIFGEYRHVQPSAIHSSSLLAQYRTSGSLLAMRIHKASSCGSYSGF